MSRKKKEKGAITGGLLGISYTVILYLISSIITLNFSVTSNSFITMLLGIFGGVVGGIIGVNF